jgi:hypothetical protein
MNPDGKDEKTEKTSKDDTHVALKIDDVTITTKVETKQEDSNV